MSKEANTVPTADPEDEPRFDGETARRILAQAAALQQHIDNRRADGYSFGELAQMAAEAGISREALVAAIERPGPDPKRRVLSALTRVPWYRSSIARKAAAAVCATGLLVPLMFAFPVLAYTVLWTSLLLIALILAGATPA